MGRPLRLHTPGQYYLFTTRCHQARFFLRPDREINDAVLEWLARAQLAFPRIRLHAVCVMSNHLHIVLQDPQADLAGWASYFLGNLARAVNRVRKRSGAFFERRYSAEPILDHEALVDRLAYVITNPVKASLCKRSSEWPGVLLWAEEGVSLDHQICWIDRAAERQAKGTEEPPSAPPMIEGWLRIDALPQTGAGPSSLGEVIRAREQTLVAELGEERPGTVTKTNVMKQPWHAAPRRPKRTPQPLCHASDSALRRAFIEGFREFTAHFREASERLRNGHLTTSFPDWSYPPGQRIHRPAHAAIA